MLVFIRRLTMTVPFVSMSEWISNTLNKNTKNSSSKSTYQPSNLWVLFCYTLQTFAGQQIRREKCLKPVSSVLNANVFVYDGLMQN